MTPSLTSIDEFHRELEKIAKMPRYLEDQLKAKRTGKSRYSLIRISAADEGRGGARHRTPIARRDYIRRGKMLKKALK